MLTKLFLCSNCQLHSTARTKLTDEIFLNLKSFNRNEQEKKEYAKMYILAVISKIKYKCLVTQKKSKKHIILKRV